MIVDRRSFLGNLTAASALPFTPSSAQSVPLRDTRKQWLGWLEKVSTPVLVKLTQRELRKRMPVEAVSGHEAERAIGSPLEAFGRLLMGIAPWLELEDPDASRQEIEIQSRFQALAREALEAALDPTSPDYMRFGESDQTLVDSSFLALAMLRAPKQLIKTLSGQTREQLITALVSERKILSGLNNWVLFAAINEALLLVLGTEWDRMRVAYALNELKSWYVGDGTYGDGPQFHADYYNSFVMHPYLLMLMQILGDEEPTWKAMRDLIQERATRYAAIQEKMIGPDGTYPILGRSITYRAGTFHLLADASLRNLLPAGLEHPQVRSALTQVQIRTLEARGTYDAGGWLTIGVSGHQPNLGETYISTGSLYLCSAAWLPLGLPTAHPFWSRNAADWTQKRIWSGLDGKPDHALSQHG